MLEEIREVRRNYLTDLMVNGDEGWAAASHPHARRVNAKAAISALATEPGQRRRVLLLLTRLSSASARLPSTVSIQLRVFGAAWTICRGRGGLVAVAPELRLHGYL